MLKRTREDMETIDLFSLVPKDIFYVILNKKKSNFFSLRITCRLFKERIDVWLVKNGSIIVNITKKLNGRYDFYNRINPESVVLVFEKDECPFKHLKQFKQLKQVRLIDRREVQDAFRFSWHFIKCFMNVESIDIENTDTPWSSDHSHIIRKDLESLTCLKSLSAFGINVNRMTQLTYLSYNSDTYIESLDLGKLTNLETLKLKNHIIQKEEFEEMLESMSKLHTLKLVDPDISSSNFPDLKQVTKLKISFGDCPGIFSLHECIPNVKKLYLSDFRGQTLNPFFRWQDLTKIIKLDLYLNSFESKGKLEAFFTQIFTLKQLRKLYLFEYYEKDRRQDSKDLQDAYLSYSEYVKTQLTHLKKFSWCNVYFQIKYEP